MYGSIGKLGIAGKPLATNQAIAFTNTRPIDALYLFYFLKYAKNRLASLGKGATQLNISQTVIKAFPFVLAPLLEQHRIVAKIEELFSDLDKGVESLKLARDQLKVYRQALLKHAFEGKLTAQWRADNLDKIETADVLLKRIQQERAQRYQQQLADWETTGKHGSKPRAARPLSQLTRDELKALPESPNGWVWMKVGNVCDCIVPNRDKPKTFSGNIPWVTTPNLSATSIRIDYQEAKLRLTLGEAGRYGAKIIPVDSVLMTCIGNFGIAAVVDQPLVINQQLHAFLPTKMLRPRFLAYGIQSSGTYFSNASTSTTVQYLNKENCNSMPLHVCSLEEQEQIVKIVETKLSSVDQLGQTIGNSIEQAEVLRQAILKKAFSGQLVPQDPADEPASALLARIKAEKAAQPTRKKARQ